jgi:hypothetical protein
MTARDDIQRVAAALARPRAGHIERLERARSAMAAESGEVARQLDVFVDRVGDLTTEELRELYEETFREPALADVHVLAARLARDPATVAEARRRSTPWRRRSIDSKPIAIRFRTSSGPSAARCSRVPITPGPPDGALEALLCLFQEL